MPPELTTRHFNSLNRQSKNMILRVHEYMKKEAEEGVSNVKQVQQRTADATGTSIRTVRDIVKKAELGAAFRTPGKRRTRIKPVTGINDYDESIIRRYIRSFRTQHNQLPTVKTLLAKLRTEINFKGGATSLRQIVKNMGFRWKTPGDSKVSVEKPQIRLKNKEYLQKRNNITRKDERRSSQSSDSSEM